MSTEKKNGAPPRSATQQTQPNSPHDNTFAVTGNLELPPFVNVATADSAKYGGAGAFLLALMRWSQDGHDDQLISAVEWWLDHCRPRCDRPTKDGHPCQVPVNVAGQACWRHRESP